MREPGVRVGQGFDVHRLAPGRPLRLGGIEIPHARGLLGHSDGDVLLHAVADALLGALGEGDLGLHFPSSDPALAGSASSGLLRQVTSLMRGRGFQVANLDASVIAEQPRLAPWQREMRDSLAALLCAPPRAVNLKLKSSDGLGAIGRGEGIAAQAVVLLARAEEAP